MDIEKLNLDSINGLNFEQEQKKQLIFSSINEAFSSKNVILFNISIIILTIWFSFLGEVEIFKAIIAYVSISMFFNFFIVAFFISNKDEEKRIEKVENILNYIEKEYGIKPILNYNDLLDEIDNSDKGDSSEDIMDENKYNDQFFNITKLIDKKFIKDNNLSYGDKPYLKYDSENFSINSLYLKMYTSGKHQTITEYSVVSRVKLNKSTNQNFILKDNVIDGFKTNTKNIIKSILNSIFWFLLIIFILFFSKEEGETINYEERFQLILHFKDYIFISLFIFILLGVVMYILNYFKVKKVSTKIDIGDLDFKYDLFLLNGEKEISEKGRNVLDYINNYTSLPENKGKVYNFFLDDEYLYIKYDMLKSGKKFINLSDYIIEVKNHILFIKDFVKLFN